MKAHVLLRRFTSPAEMFLLISLVALFIVKALIPAWTKLYSDFSNYYIVARLLHEHWVMDRIYDWVWLQRVKDHWTIPQPLVGFLGLTPFSALPLVALAWLDALDAKRVWLVFNLAILAGVMLGLHQVTSLSMRRIALITFLCIIPLRNNFLTGQMHLLVLGLLVLAYFLDTRKMWASCGIVLGIAVSLKVYPLLFVFYFLRKRQWKTAAMLVGSTLAILAMCFLIFGAPVMRIFLIEQFPRMLRGEATNPFTLTAPSASSVMHRLFLAQPQLNAHPPIFSPLLYSLLYPLWQLLLFSTTLLTISSRDGDQRLKGMEWACWICLLLTLSTQPASYHSVVLIAVVVLAAHAMEPVGGGIRERRRQWMLLGSYFIACNVHPIISDQYPAMTLLLDTFPYWGLIGMMVCLLSALRAHTSAVTSLTEKVQPPKRPLWIRPQFALVLISFVALWALVSTATYMHVRSLPDSSYLPDRPNGGFAYFAPHPTGGRLLSVAMVLEGYRVEDEDGQRLPTNAPGLEDDQLALASAPNQNRVWIEAATGGGSRLVERELYADKAYSAPIATISDAESPSLSVNGRELAFLRESKGVGSAWMVHLDKDGKPLGAPSQISIPGMDVRHVTFAGSDEIILDASEFGVTHLYSTHVTVQGTPQREPPPRRLFIEEDSMDSPARSVANAQLVYRKRVGSNWHLFMSNLSQGGETQLTFGDCNARDPIWRDSSTLFYTSDCGRGNGISALAVLRGDFSSSNQVRNASLTTPMMQSHGAPPQ